MPVMAGMKVNTKSDKTRIARGGVMEFLLANHPLDCPICDQGGECDLQDISESYGYKTSRFMEYKRGVEDKEIGPIVKTTMTRCIHCTRCIRFSEEVAGNFSLGTTGRGKATEVSTYVEQLHFSELSGNIVDLCPVGALTNKPYAFKARPWELKSTPTVDTMDTILPPVNIDSRGIEVMRVLPMINEDVNEEWISDKSRHAFDGNKRQRLTVPMIKNDKGELVDKDWDVVLEEVGSIFKSVKKEDIQILIGEQIDLETLCAIRDFSNRLNIENISLGRNSLKIDNSIRSGYLMNSRIRGIDDSDCLLLIGINPKYESPVLNSRIRKNVRNNGLKVGLIGAPYDLTYNYDHIGSTSNSLISLIEGKHPFCSKIQNSKLPMMIISSSLFKRKDGKELYEILLRLSKVGNFYNPSKNWNGFNILHNEMSTIAALELGIKPFIDQSNTDMTKIREPKLVYLLGYDDFRGNDIPDDAFVVYQGSHGDKGAERADVILPGSTYLEKDATWVSTEGRVDSTRSVILPPYLARDDWEIIRALSEVVDEPLPYDEVFELRNRLVEIAPHFIRYNHVEEHRFENLIFNRNQSESLNLNGYTFPDAIDVSPIILEFLFNQCNYQSQSYHG